MEVAADGVVYWFLGICLFQYFILEELYVYHVLDYSGVDFLDNCQERSRAHLPSVQSLQLCYMTLK